MRKFILLFICMFFLILYTETPHAYFSLPDDPGRSLLQQERHYEDWQGKKRSLAFYDNLNHFSAKKNSNPVVNKLSDIFIPFDIIDCNIKVSIVMDSKKTVDDNITNLIYANLRLKQLIDDYLASQKRAIEVLEGLSVPYIDFRNYLFFSSIRLAGQGTYANSGNGTSNMALENSESLQEGIRDLYESSLRGQAANTTNRSFRLSGGPIGGTRSLGSGSYTAPITNNKISKNKKEFESLDKNYGSPLIDRLISAIWKYTQVHKIETAIYALILYLIIVAGSAVLSRK